jgi:hypothetical protein
MEPDWSIRKTKSVGLVLLISAEYGIPTPPMVLNYIVQSAAIPLMQLICNVWLSLHGTLGSA